MTDTLPRVALIAGPTASGKSALAIALAKAHRGTVINADSAQVYRDLRILSARPSAEEEAQVPHRLFGHVDGAENYSAARWAREARTEIASAHANNRLPILVGGTGMYMRTLIEGIAPVPEIDAEVRAEVRARPVAQNYRDLQSLDPASAQRLRPTDTTRIARALEVVRSTGRPLADWQRAKTGGIGNAIRLMPLVLLPDRAWLTDRCDRRFVSMLDHGAVPEALALAARADIPDTSPVRRAIGVPQILGWQAGEISRDQAVSDAQAATRQYAKRQYTWFRNQPPPAWQRVSETEKIQLHLIFETLFL
ncbi:tRNA (adenosine(37)-N6)-dimethylallyltransferase MiaA [Stakelama sp. CBK3Z-3]|uniref:tRNA dimethylallyltransferase n=1 Tax=Stakelama flava TaxID=2860338 RepID=A0ABS6XHB3_9SPHN|nr:tRNA (adenosine(37)-N6)-dimethylallyltransferase MiaA [Stakelama flava]MBW4329591.1 tRNA (adenosine(37)-N6)-dimethylallyltransferase MiaA [Stakelama flava]